jgi:glutamine amidotransferase
VIALVDYGAGNVRSVQKALETVGADVCIARDAGPLLAADKVVLPGVGAFGDCMSSLDRAGLVEGVKEIVSQGKLLLGICVGLQVLFEEGEEMGRHEGLGLLPGRVVRFSDELPRRGLKVPHTGWNEIEPARDHPLLEGLSRHAWGYFNHAFYGRARQEHVMATTDYGGRFASVVGRDNVYGIQFHPEKSQRIGLQVLRNFVERM